MQAAAAAEALRARCLGGGLRGAELQDAAGGGGRGCGRGGGGTTSLLVRAGTSAALALLHRQQHAANAAHAAVAADTAQVAGHAWKRSAGSCRRGSLCSGAPRSTRPPTSWVRPRSQRGRRMARAEGREMWMEGQLSAVYASAAASRPRDSMAGTQRSRRRKCTRQPATMPDRWPTKLRGVEGGGGWEWTGVGACGCCTGPCWVGRALTQCPASMQP